MSHMQSVSCYECKTRDPFLYLRDVLLNDLNDCLHGIFSAKYHFDVQGHQICHSENETQIMATIWAKSFNYMSQMSDIQVELFSQKAEFFTLG